MICRLFSLTRFLNRLAAHTISGISDATSGTIPQAGLDDFGLLGQSGKMDPPQGIK
jgi:hypothetical protein